MSIEEPDHQLESGQPEARQEQKARWRRPVKLIGASAISVVLGFGLCVEGGMPMSNDHPILAGFGLVAFWGGLLALLVGFVWWIVALNS